MRLGRFLSWLGCQYAFKLLWGYSKHISAAYHLENECRCVPNNPFLSISAATILFEYASVLILLLPSLTVFVHSLSTAEINLSFSAIDFPEVQLNGLQDSARSGLTLMSAAPSCPIPSSLHSLRTRSASFLLFAWLTPHSLES